MNRDTLAHYGVLGMRWGIRRKRSTISTSTKKNPSELEDVHEDHTKALTNKRAKSLSDKELKDKISRINMEKQYAKLTMSKKEKAMNTVKEILGNAAKQTAATYTAKYMAKGVETLLKRLEK